MAGKKIYIFIYFFLLLFIGSYGFYIIGQPDWTVIDSIYMTIITLATVGYGEVQPLGESGKIWAILVIIFGVSGIGILFTTLREEIMQIDQYKKRKIMKKISKFKNHLIICGYGRMGAVIASELAEKDLYFIIIEQNVDKIEVIRQKGMYCIHGDVTKEETLQAARIEHAKGAAVVLDTDQDNLFVTMSIRTYNPDLFLLSRCAVEDNKEKLIRAGADKVVNPYTAGGHRMAEMLTKPQVEDSVSITTPKYDNIDL
ncbi:MAG: potassium channel family protein, partial [Candidatus Marinimicrobia bacterium]|nr:potassium channel family protein [Candidatus Neomarinimicrobiota bacterium]